MHRVMLFVSAFLTTFLFGNNRDSILSGKETSPILVDDVCVYNNSSHAAFTTLATWKGKDYIAFREGRYHRATLNDKGVIQVLVKKRNKWKKQKTFLKDGVDLRDPFFLRRKNQLYLYTLCGYYSKFEYGKWAELSMIVHDVSHPISIWKIREFKGILYGVGYRGGYYPVLLSSKDGINWKSILTIEIGGNASEADLSFVNDSIYICLRVDEPIGSRSMWGTGQYPFTSIDWRTMDISVASPELLYLKDKKRFLVAGREYILNNKNSIDTIAVSVFTINKSGDIEDRIVLKTGRTGDKGYPSFCQKKRNLYMSYYKGVDSITEIRLCTFHLPKR